MSDERSLRDTKSELVSGLADLDRRAGKIPEIRKHEDMVDGALSKALVDVSNAPAPRAPRVSEEREVRSGEWYGDEGHSPQIGRPLRRAGEAPGSRVAAPLPGESMRLESKPLGEYAIGKTHAHPLGNAPASYADVFKEDPRETKLREGIRILYREFPDYRHQLRLIAMSNENADQKAKKYQAIMDEATRLLGAMVPVKQARKDRKKIIA